MTWPAGVPKGFYIQNYIRLFRHLGYEPCDSSGLEDGFEKVALYADEMGIVFTHVAKQLPDGSWTSKLGPYEDIQHNSLDAFDGSDYGKLAVVMKRRGVTAWPPYPNESEQLS